MSSSTSHLSIEAFNGLTGAALQHVPYGSGGAMAPDLVAGNINAAITEISTALPLHRAGQARILAVGTAARMGLAPEVPTFAEGGVPNFRPAAYLGIVFPPNPPAEALAALHAALTATLADPAVRQRIEQAGSEPAGAEEASPAGFAAFLKAELETTRAAAEKAGLRQG